jgi:hypothetical protein
MDGYASHAEMLKRCYTSCHDNVKMWPLDLTWSISMAKVWFCWRCCRDRNNQSAWHFGQGWEKNGKDSLTVHRLKRTNPSPKVLKRQIRFRLVHWSIYFADAECALPWHFAGSDTTWEATMWRNEALH